MGVIHQLPPDLASQIAAGEVVERPASAVKELVENALDADASRCDVEIEGGGIRRLSVSDDGVGMSPEDALQSIQRHATSKLFSLDDLSRVRSFGFRGEALPSIASVSRFRLWTRARGGDAGTELELNGGGEPEAHPAGLPPGTKVEVSDLFFNVPARRKFLRSSGTESGHVTGVVEAAALARPEVTFTLRRDGRLVRELLRAQGREERVRQLHSGEELAACRGERGPLRIEAFLSRPERARSGAGGLSLLVNGRPVKDRALALTVAQAYGSVLERGRYPRGVVYLDLPPELVDVNVHPQKSEVRFADPRATTDALYGILAKELAGAFSLPPAPRGAWQRPRGDAVPSASLGTDARSGSARDVGEHRSEPDPWGLAPAAASESEASARVLETDAGPLIAVRDGGAAAPIRPRPEVQWSSLRFVAQLRQTYLLCEGPDGLYVLDQHAAAERVNFHRLRSQYQSRAVPSQSLLFPVTLEVSVEEAELVDLHGEEISGVGLDVRRRGNEALSIHAVPKLLQRASPERLVRDLLAEVSRSGGRGFSNAVDLALATMACHGSMRAGDPLSPSAAKALLEALDQADFAGHCPHGRPVVTFTSWAELERKVGRR